MSRPIAVAGPATRVAYLQPYLAAVRGAGASPVLVWPDPETLADPAEIRSYLSGFAGLLLPGGKDVEPWRFGEEPHPRLGDTDAALDAGELALTAAALDLALPVLAICRGIQVLGVAVGGTLYQDLPSQRPSPVDHQVRTTPATLAHEVEVAPGSVLGNLVGTTRFPVNSRHHQAVRAGGAEQVGPLTVVAQAPDGVVEALELPGERFVLGVQWHPENLVGDREEARRLFRGFVEASRS
jgi:putative glutamine amidotransferase